MDMRKHLGVALIGLTLLGAGCAVAPTVPKQNLPQPVSLAPVPSSAPLKKEYLERTLKFSVPESWVVKIGLEIDSQWASRGADALITSRAGVLIGAVSSGGPFCADGDKPGVCFSEGTQMEIKRDDITKAPARLIATSYPKVWEVQKEESWCEAGCPDHLYYFDGERNDYAIDVWTTNNELITDFLKSLHE